MTAEVSAEVYLYGHSHLPDVVPSSMRHCLEGSLGFGPINPRPERIVLVDFSKAD
jgi:hypothetical protein